MSKKFYVVNAGRFGGTSRATHIMQSNDSSTPDPMSPGSIIAQLIWFGGNAKTTLCGLPATRYVNVFDPSEVSCRECKKRWHASREAKMEALDEIDKGLDELQVIVDGMVADRQAAIKQIEDRVDEVSASNRELEKQINDFAADVKLTKEARKAREADLPKGPQTEEEGDAIVTRWIEEDIPQEDRTVNVVFDPETGESRIVYGIREH